MEITIATVFFWIVISSVLGYAGSRREIGGILAFIISLFLSPLAGFIAVLFSPDNAELAHRRKMVESNEKIVALLQNVDANKMDVDEL